MSLPGYDAWKLHDPRESDPDPDDDCCEECGDPKRYDRILKRDLCSCDDAEYFTEPDDEYIDDRDGALADRMAP